MKIFHDGKVVKVIDDKDLPTKPGLYFADYKPFPDWPEHATTASCAATIYKAALAAALSEKGVEVTNVHLNPEEGVFQIAFEFGPEIIDNAKENTLYDLPEGFEVNISDRVDIEQVPNDERMRNKSGCYKVATLVPKQPEPVKEEDQDQLWDEVLQNAPDFGYETRESDRLKDYIELLRNKYVITRKQ